jgi:hypothetical protein
MNITKAEARKIGRRQGMISVGIGILIAQLVMTAFLALDEGIIGGFFWFTDFGYLLNILIGLVIMILGGYLFGSIAGYQILIKKRNPLLIGFLCGMAVLLTTGFFSGWLGFFQEGIENIGYDNPFEDYIFKPLFWVTLVGSIPAFLIGSWMGSKIKSMENRQKSL